MYIKLTDYAMNTLSRFYACAFDVSTPSGDTSVSGDDLATKLGKIKANNDEKLSAELYRELKGLVKNIATKSTGLSEGQIDTLQSILSNLEGLEKGEITSMSKSLMSREIIQSTITLVTEVVSSGAATSEEKGKNVSNAIPKGFETTLKSVKENPGGGECLLFAALQNQEKSGSEGVIAEPGFEDARKLRGELLSHVKTQAAKLLGKDGGKMDYVNFPGSTHPLLVADLTSPDKYEGNNSQLPLTYVPFLADMLQRPIVVVMDIVGSKAKKGSECVVYRNGVDGKELKDKPPLAIFYAGIADSTDKNGKTVLGGGHFRAAEMTDEKLKELGF